LATSRQIFTCSGAHAPGGQPVRRGEAVEHADVLRRQELHELAVLEHFSFAVEDGGGLVRDGDDPSRDDGNRHCKNVLLREIQTAG